MPSTGEARAEAAAPARLDTQRLYDRYISTHFGRHRAISRAGFKRDARTWRDYIGPLLPREKSARIADIGCGSGSFLYFLRAEGYAGACGVDISPEQIEAARALGIPRVTLGDSHGFLAAHAGEFDCVTCFDVLEHIPRAETLGFLEALRGALRPGGRLILKTANGGGPFAARILYGDFTHEVAFSASSLRQILQLSGFERAETYPEGPRVHGPVSAARWAAWQMIVLGLRFYLAAETGQVRKEIFTQNLIAVARKPSEAIPQPERVVKEAAHAAPQ